MATDAFMIIPRRYIDHLDEALALAETAGYRVVRVWKSRYPNRLGRGLVEEVALAAQQAGVDTVIFYGELQPSSAFQLMKESRARVIDRVQLILEIFVKHAGSREAMLQIEMARIRHELPLVREFIRRSKMGELPGFLGPGGYAVDSYYRHLRRRLAKLRRELEDLRRLRQRRLRERDRRGMLHVSIVGYASAGKTSLFNALTGLHKPVGPEYFTTLSPKHYAVSMKGTKIVLVDTVGFIRDIPPEVIEAFYSTLEEIAYSNAIIFVVDVSEDIGTLEEKVRSGFEIMARIGAVGAPVVIAANKIDLVEDYEDRVRALEEVASRHGWFDAIVPISARKRINLDVLTDTLIEVLGGGGGASGALREGLRAETRP